MTSCRWKKGSLLVPIPVQQTVIPRVTLLGNTRPLRQDSLTLPQPDRWIVILWTEALHCIDVLRNTDHTRILTKLKTSNLMCFVSKILYFRFWYFTVLKHINALCNQKETLVLKLGKINILNTRFSSSVRLFFGDRLSV